MGATALAKHGQVPVSLRLLSSIRPSPENEKLYRPVSPADTEVRELAESIRQYGLREPIVVTTDGKIISGHRRYAACKLAGLAEVPCRVEDLHSSDPRFVTLLREYNRQRVKGLDEVIREEIVSADPEEAYRLLVEHRKRRAQVNAETFTIEGKKCRCSISRAKGPLLQAVLTVLEEQRDFWPLTDRRVHYALLNDPPLRHASKPGSTYRNDRDSYKDLTDLLTRGRLQGRIPWEAIHDPTRPMVTWDCHPDPAPFVRGQLNGFLKGYYRDLQQSQPNHIEIVGEKNTIESTVRPVAMEYCIPYTLGRGYSSLDPRREVGQRFRRSGKERLVLLALSDFDPEGEDIAHSFARSMRDDFGIEGIEPIKVALTARQVEEMRLPPQFKAKKKSSRYGKFVGRFGENVHELEAVPPRDLQVILREAIDGVLDVDAFNAEIDAEKRDAARLDAIRLALLKQIGPGGVA
jgi:hypothetical protein